MAAIGGRVAMASVCVFCGSQVGSDPAFVTAAVEATGLLMDGDHTIVYGGGSTGIMGVVADEVLGRSGSIIGVIPKALATVELMHTDVDDMRVVADMHERKSLMHDLADAYLILPGGYGTLEELFEAVCWNQLGFHESPVAILNTNGFYDGLVTLIDRMLSEGFVHAPHRQLIRILEKPSELPAFWEGLGTCDEPENA